MGLLLFLNFENFCLHRSLSTQSQSRKFTSLCATLTRSLGIFKGWSQSPNFYKPWSRCPTKNEDSTSLHTTPVV